MKFIFPTSESHKVGNIALKLKQCQTIALRIKQNQTSN